MSRFYTRRGTRLLASMVSVTLSGCTVGPDFHTPAPPSEHGYLPPDVTPAMATAERVELGGRAPDHWWTSFDSAQLNEIVDAALAHNNNLAVAQANVKRAGQLVAQSQGALYPQLDARAGAERMAYGAYFLGPLSSTFPTFSAYSGGLDFSYDPDIFGGNDRRVEASKAEAQVQGDALNAARLAAIGGAVLAAIDIATARGEEAVEEQIVNSDAETLRLVQVARKVGVASDMDLATAESQLNRDRAQLPQLRQSLASSSDALAVLTGKAPADSATPHFDLANLTLPQDIPVSVPSELVRVRPDIRAAEARLHESYAEIGVATADLYPKLTLSASGAAEGLLGGPAAAAWSLIGGATAPIFHGGALQAQRRAAIAASEAAFASYQQTVLSAFREIADDLQGLRNAFDQLRAEQQALQSAETALRLTRLGYTSGNAELVQVLDAQRLQQQASFDLVRVQASRYSLTTNLFLALSSGEDASPAGQMTTASASAQ